MGFVFHIPTLSITKEFLGQGDLQPSILGAVVYIQLEVKVMELIIMKVLYFAFHFLTGCKDENLEWYKDKKATCTKCGRVYFNFKRY